jgi:hypothetical protein
MSICEIGLGFIEYRETTMFQVVIAKQVFPPRLVVV